MAEVNNNDADVVDLTLYSDDDDDGEDDTAYRMEQIKQDVPLAPRSKTNDDDNEKDNIAGSTVSTEDDECGTAGNGIGNASINADTNNRKQSISAEEFDRRLAVQKAVLEEQYKLQLKVQLGEQENREELLVAGEKAIQEEQHTRQIAALEAEHRRQLMAQEQHACASQQEANDDAARRLAARERQIREECDRRLVFQEEKHKRQMEACQQKDKILQLKIAALESQLRQTSSTSATLSATSASFKSTSATVPATSSKGPMELLLSELPEEDSTEINSDRNGVDVDEGNNQNVHMDNSDSSSTDENDRKLPAKQLEDATNSSSDASSDKERRQQNFPESNPIPNVATAPLNAAAENGGMDSDASSVDSYQEPAIVSKEDIWDGRRGESRQYKLEHIDGKGTVDKPFDKIDLEFCCAECRCIGLEEICKILTSEDCFWSSEETLHRRCCHGHLQKDLDPGLTPGELAFTSFDGPPPPPKKAIERTSNPYNRQTYDLDKDEYYGILQQRKERQNDTNDEDKSKDYLFVASTCPKHKSNLEKFQQLVQNKSFRPREDGIVVVDFFAGQGTGRVALEKNGIRVKKYIAVEIDPVALFVLKYNHDVEFCKGIDVTTHHICNRGPTTTMVYYDKFEDVESELDNFLKEHAIDLVLGGPPCQDFSKVNGGRQGVKGEQGKYHPRLGSMIRKIERRAKEEGRHLYFLIENVPTNGNDSKKLEDAYGIPPIHIDAQNYSPACRDRAFYTNLPLTEDPQERNDCSKFSSAKSCLDDGYVLKGDATNGLDYQGGKAHTFMASLYRISHARMQVVKEVSDGKLHIRNMSVGERSRMMGYHDAYVTEPLKHLFRALLKPLRGGRIADRGFVWNKDLPKGFHCFSGVCHKFDDESNELKIAAHPSGLRYCEEEEEEEMPKRKEKGKKRKHAMTQIKWKAPHCFDETDYGCHLIGNAYSVPVVEMLLRPLIQVFEAGDEYKGHQYKYFWLRNE